MLIPRSFAELDRLSQTELRSAYDEMGGSGTYVQDPDFVLREIDRKRSAERETQMLDRTRTLTLLTWCIAALTVANVVLVALTLAE